MTAYCETCASIGNVLWNYRMFLLTGESKYYDVLERTLYNALLSGVSLSGDRFFYPNPLESHGQYERAPWFGCACCPSNICRFLPSIPGFIYSTDNRSVFVNLYVQNEAEIDLAGSKTLISQKTGYPWNGKIEISVTPGPKSEFGIAFRIPGWAMGEVVPTDLYLFTPQKTRPFNLKLNGRDVKYEMKNGYAFVYQVWKQGDKIELNLPMQIQKIRANEKIDADHGKLAIQRGPLVYCLEWPDNPDENVTTLAMDNNVQLQSSYRADLLKGVEIISGKAKLIRQTAKDTDVEKYIRFTAIPYYAWANRGKGEMMVWIPVK